MGGGCSAGNDVALRITGRIKSIVDDFKPEGIRARERRLAKLVGRLVQ
jgi:hypothetical protein